MGLYHKFFQLRNGHSPAKHSVQILQWQKICWIFFKREVAASLMDLSFFPFSLGGIIKILSDSIETSFFHEWLNTNDSSMTCGRRPFAARCPASRRPVSGQSLPGVRPVAARCPASRRPVSFWTERCTSEEPAVRCPFDLWPLEQNVLTSYGARTMSKSSNRRSWKKSSGARIFCDQGINDHDVDFIHRSGINYHPLACEDNIWPTFELKSLNLDLSYLLSSIDSLPNDNVFCPNKIDSNCRRHFKCSLYNFSFWQGRKQFGKRRTCCLHTISDFPTIIFQKPSGSHVAQW